VYIAHTVLVHLCNEMQQNEFKLTDQIKEVLTLDEEIHKLAEELYQQKSLLIMGRGFNYATCLEGALASKSYIHSCLSFLLSRCM